MSNALTERYHIIAKRHTPCIPSQPIRVASIFSQASTSPCKHPLGCSDDYGFGMCIVLLVINTPLRTNSPTTGWNSNIVPVPQVPRGKFSRVQPCDNQYAIRAAIDSDVGIGVPSKYLLLPVASFGTFATVMLKRARRVSPQRTKNVRKMWSRGVRRPIAKAAAAGETPNETYLC
jgi:hypothetical protein